MQAALCALSLPLTDRQTKLFAPLAFLGCYGHAFLGLISCFGPGLLGLNVQMFADVLHFQQLAQDPAPTTWNFGENRSDKTGARRESVDPEGANAFVEHILISVFAMPS